MGVRLTTLPRYSVRCDGPRKSEDPFDQRRMPCAHVHAVQTWSKHGARIAAREIGWQVRPQRGAGSRSAPDLCPDHREDKTA